jgi:hypothetical protein
MLSLLPRLPVGHVRARSLAKARTAPGASAAPSYIQSMAAFDVQRLSNVAPTNGNDTISDITPSEWLTSDPGTVGLRAIIDAWCGGFKAVGHPELLVHGGGHNDSANNSVPQFDMSGTSAPTGWTMAVSPSAVADVRTGFDTYTDGKPVAVHTYDGCVRVGNFGYRFGGSQWSSGSFTDACWKVNLANGTWTQLSDFASIGSTAASCVYDSVSGKILVMPINVFQNWRFLNTANDSTTDVTRPSESLVIPEDACSAYDPTRNRILSIGAGANRLTTVDFSANTVSDMTTQAITGLGANMGAGVSLLYDPDLDCYWCWGGTAAATAGYQNMYRINASTFAVTSSALSQTMAVFADTDCRGSFGRFAFMPEWRAIAFCTHVSSNTGTHIIKLPSS